MTGVPTALPSTSSCTENGPVPPVTVATAELSAPCANVQSGGTSSITPSGSGPTVKATGAELVVLPAASVAFTAIWCWPCASAETSSVAEYVYEPDASGAVSTGPTGAPSIVNWTLWTPWASETCACAGSDDGNVSPTAGERIWALGGVLSTVTGRACRSRSCRGRP